MDERAKHTRDVDFKATWRSGKGLEMVLRLNTADECIEAYRNDKLDGVSMVERRYSPMHAPTVEKTVVTCKRARRALLTGMVVDIFQGV